MQKTPIGVQRKVSRRAYHEAQAYVGAVFDLLEDIDPEQYLEAQDPPSRDFRKWPTAVIKEALDNAGFEILASSYSWETRTIELYGLYATKCG